MHLEYVQVSSASRVCAVGSMLSTTIKKIQKINQKKHIRGIMKSLKNEKCKTSVTNDDMCI